MRHFQGAVLFFYEAQIRKEIYRCNSYDQGNLPMEAVFRSYQLWGKKWGKPKGLSILNTETHPNQDEHILISRQREQIEFCKKFTWSSEGRSFHSHQKELNY